MNLIFSVELFTNFGRNMNLQLTNLLSGSKKKHKIVS